MGNKLLLSAIIASSLSFYGCSGQKNIAVENNQHQNIEEKFDQESQNSLKIFNGNMLGLPKSFSADKDKRIDSLISLVHKYNPDVICLQEVWLRKDLEKLKNAFKGYEAFTSEKGSTYNMSGLVTFSKYEVERAEFQKSRNRKNAGDIGSLSSKSYIKIWLEGTDVYVTNTGLYSRGNKKESEMTLSQLDTEKVLFYTKK